MLNVYSFSILELQFNLVMTQSDFEKLNVSLSNNSPEGRSLFLFFLLSIILNAYDNFQLNDLIPLMSCTFLAENNKYLLGLENL